MSMFVTSKSRRSYRKSCKKQCFVEIVFYDLVIRFSLFVRGLGVRFSDFLSLENKVENTETFGDVTDPEFGIWGRRSKGYVGPLKK